MKKGINPIEEKSRIDWIDMARGFAIFGIFAVNILGFSAPYFMYGGMEAVWAKPLDAAVLALVDIFFQGSFYTLFSILFGFSWQLMLDRMAEKELPYRSFLLKRQFILLGFGAVHAYLIWYGDILLSYGLVGLFLLLFIDIEDRHVLLWAAFLLGGIVTLITAVLYPVREFLDTVDEQAVKAAIEAYSSNDLSAVLAQNLQDWSYTNSGIGFVLLILTLLPFFLFGMYLSRKRLLHKPHKHRNTLKKMLVISLILFIVLKAGPYLIGNPKWLSYLQDNIGGGASALFYIISITFIAQSPLGEKVLQPFKYAGRMALSNYIFQSAVCFLLFYGIGFGLYDSVRPPVLMLIAIFIFALQAVFSKWWFSKFRFGPLEWVMRTINYGRKQSLRK